MNDDTHSGLTEAEMMEMLFARPNYYGEWDAIVSLANSVANDNNCNVPQHLKDFVGQDAMPKDIEGYVRYRNHYWRVG